MFIDASKERKAITSGGDFARYHRRQMPTQPGSFLTREEYLEIEREADFKSEYYRGEMYAMSGGSLVHSAIAVNLTALLWRALHGGRCRLFNSDLRLCIEPAGLVTYPDVMIICGDPQFVDLRKDTVTNPVALFEVPSPGTEAYDRGVKFHACQKIPTLREYVLVSQDAAVVDHFEKQPNGHWQLTTCEGLEADITLSSVPCTLKLADIIYGVPLPGTPA